MENLTNTEIAMAEQFKFETQEENLHFENVYDVDPVEVRRRLSEIHLIDVRQPEEFVGEHGHIPDSELIVLDTLPDRIDEIPHDKAVVLVCRSGSRSARAAAYLQQCGFRNVFNLKGGMILWNDLHFETEV